MRTALLIDIGSTYTKASLLDLEGETLIQNSQAHTTVKKDVTIGLRKALKGLKGWEKAVYKLACSSAAGGLKMIAVGLVPDLTAEAAKRAALGAGSKVLATYSYELSKRELKEIEDSSPDIILLAGGTDGGNKEVILHNARLLAGSDLIQPIIVAGNKVVAAEVEEILNAAGKEVYITENVMPELEKLNIKPCRQKIRQIFLEKIVNARGLNKVTELIEGVVMPTPAAVLNGAALLADGYREEPGLGELLVLDIGGATTDVHSIAKGMPTQGSVNLRGLEEPYRKRTVEGDLGMRYSAPSLLEAMGKQQEELTKYVKKVHNNVDYLPETEREREIDNLLARNAAQLAIGRHVGKLEKVYTPMGATSVQEGKDLTEIKYIIGTGGIIVNNENPTYILEGGLYNNMNNPQLLAPIEPDLLIDSNYLLAATGLLAEVEPLKALKIIKKHLKGEDNCGTCQ